MTPSTLDFLMRAPLALAGLLLLAGCVTPANVQTAGMPPASPDLLGVLAAAPVPALDGNATLQWLQSFVDAHHPRLTGTPGEKAAADDLAAQLAKLGYKVERRTYGANGLPSADGPLQVVLAVKEGATQPDRLVILGAHYDTSAIGNSILPPVPVGPPPLHAAYDNGSGTAMVMELARLLANVTTQKTIQFAFFNGEEEGILGSQAYAAELAAKGATVDAYVGFDMVGINWPSAAGCLCIYAGEKFAADLNPVQEAVAFGFLEYPRSDEQVQVLDNHKTRNSDEAAFQAKGFPTMRWAGMKSAGAYWGYHRLNDTMETMAKQAGGADLLAAGTQRVAESAYYTVLAMDARP